MPEEINVPLLDLRAQYDSIRDEIEPILRDVVESQWFIMGPKVAEFEQAVADYCGAKYAVGCASGSDSLLLALMASDIGPGDEVICPSMTFWASIAQAQSNLGASVRETVASIEEMAERGWARGAARAKVTKM